MQLVFVLLLAGYGYFFWLSVREYWFNPLYTTDDALQQLFPLYEATHPGIFRDDIVTESMRLYLAPLHYWISFYTTKLIGDPNIAGHVLHVVQLGGALVFLFLLVRKLASTSAALFSVIWFLHTRNLVQRMTCGLPRGWAGVILTASLYFLVARNHWGVIITLLLGTLLNPPAAFLAAATYGLFLALGVVQRRTRAEFLRPFKRFALAAPLIAAVAFLSVQRPPEIGKMVTYAEAEQLPGFSRSGGRFPFVPLKDAVVEINSVGMQAFVNRWEKPHKFIRQNILWIVTGFFVALLGIQISRRVPLFPQELLVYLVSIIGVYFASRLLAFRLYVPDRHLQFPLNIFHIVGFTVALWRLGAVFHPFKLRFEKAAALNLFFLGLVLYLLGGTGLEGVANFNTRTDQRQGLYTFLRTQTEPTVMVAGHPSRLDGVHLFGMRKGYITTETAHPFYDKYYEEVLRRLKVVFRAYYARSAEELLEAIGSEDIDYFVFFDEDFTLERLKKSGYDKPYKEWVRRLGKRAPREQLFFASLPSALSAEKPYLIYRDAESAVIDLRKLRETTGGAGEHSPKNEL